MEGLEVPEPEVDEAGVWEEERTRPVEEAKAEEVADFGLMPEEEEEGEEEEEETAASLASEDLPSSLLLGPEKTDGLA